jgi:Aerotolerance regulator N-terminal
MSLTFLNPLMLIALAAAVLPILIHRLTHRKAVRRNFSAVRLLLHSQNLMARPQRLKHLLLLGLRVTAIAALVIMAARPMLVRPGLLVVGEGGAKALLIDNSVSMGYKDAQGQRYERAKEAARQMINGLRGPTGQVLIIPTTASAQDKLAEQSKADWMKPAQAAEYVASIPLSSGKGEPGAALTLAFQKLKEVKGTKEIMLIGDMAKSDWQGFDQGKLGILPADVHVTFLRIGGKTRDANMAVKAVRLKEGELVAGTTVRLEVTVSRLSDQPASTTVQLTLGNTKVDQSVLELKAGEDGMVSFDLLLGRPGSVNAQMRLSGDNLPYDDLFSFPLKVREKIKVLVVDGDPRGAIRASESYYLSRALQPGDVAGSPFQIKVISEKDLSDIDLKPYEALYLLNVAKPAPSKIAAFLDAGNPVFIFLGDRILPEEYNSIPLFPWRLREVREANAQRPESITRVDYSDEALNQFSGVGRESLEGAMFRRYYRVTGSGKALLALGNKDPLFLESPLGKGKMFLYTSSADADWNDLPLKAAYVPLVQGMLKEAVGLTKGSAPADRRIGGPAIPPEESDLAKLTDEDIRKQFSGMGVQVKEYDEAASGRMRGSRQELWTYLLGFLLLVLALEMGVANRL